MTELTDNDIAKMDAILEFLVEHENMGYEETYASEKLKLDIKEFNYLYEKIIEFSSSVYPIGKLLEPVGTWVPIRTDFTTKRFIRNGGFKEYYNKDIIDFESADTLLQAYKKFLDRPMQPDKLNTNLSQIKLKKACSLLSKLELIVYERQGFGDFSEYEITKVGFITNGVKEYYEKLKNIEKGKIEFNFSGPVQLGDNHGSLNQTVGTSHNVQTINKADEGKEKTEKKSFLLKFWTLISENKLISGFILLIIAIILAKLGLS